MIDKEQANDTNSIKRHSLAGSDKIRVHETLPIRRRPIEHALALRSAQDTHPRAQMSLLLSRAGLCDLTGFKSPKKQSEWLSSNGYKFDVRADGRPNVLIAQLRDRQGCTASVRTNPTEPDYSWLNRAPKKAKNK